HNLIAANSSVSFVGNVESKGILKGVCDVVVADGFTCNAVLKVIEGTVGTAMHLLKDTMMSAGLLGRSGDLLLQPSIMNIRNKMSASQYGGAVLLGAKAPVVKAHGASDAETVYYTVKQINDMLENDMLSKFT